MHPIVPSPKAEFRDQRAEVRKQCKRAVMGDRGKPITLPRGVQRNGAFMTAKRVNARQKESKIYSGKTCLVFRAAERSIVGVGLHAIVFGGERAFAAGPEDRLAVERIGLGIIVVEQVDLIARFWSYENLPVIVQDLPDGRVAGLARAVMRGDHGGGFLAGTARLAMLCKAGLHHFQ